MLERTKEIWVDIRESLWFIPMIMSIASVVLAFTLIEVDGRISYDDLPSRWFLYAGNRAGARSVLSTIASSMATIAGVTFSMTLVTLTLASSQYGPRLLRKFITDKGNQTVLGTFVATFIYSLIVLLTIKESDDSSFIPKFSILFGVVLSLCSFGVLIFFIHHAATSIQAENIINSSSKDLIDAVEKFMDERPVDDLTVAKIENMMHLETYERQTITCTKSGYLQRINYRIMGEWAAENKVIIRLLVQPGDFFTVREPQLIIYHKGDFSDGWKEKADDFFEMGSKRTPEQEIRFSIKQIVEIGVRAMSPGINDPHTAISSIHYLGAVLVNIGTKYFPSIVEKDEAGNIRIIRKENNFSDLVDACFDQFRWYAKSNIFVAAEMLMALERAATHTIHAEMQNAIQRKAAVIIEQLRLEKMPDSDFQKAMKVYDRIRLLSNQYSVRVAPEAG